MSGFVYIWYDRKHKRYYVGSHWGPEDDGYVCSSTWMKQAYRIRPEDFRRRVIARVSTTRADLLVEEERWLQMMRDDEIKTRYYNLHRRTGHWHGDSEKLKTVGEKLSHAIKTKRASDPEYCERVRLKTIEGTLKSKRDNPEKWAEANRQRAKSMKAAWQEKPESLTNSVEALREASRERSRKAAPKKERNPFHQRDRRLREMENATADVDFWPNWKEAKGSVQRMMDICRLTRRQVEFLLEKHAVPKPKQGWAGKNNLPGMINTREIGA